MAPQLTNKELDFIVKNGQSAPTEVHAKLVKMRARKQLDGPHLTSVRRALKGQTHRRGRIETRGRKRKLQPRSVRRLNTVRKELQKKVKGDREVPWEEVIRKARGPKVHPSTAARRLMEAGYDVKWRRPREKPLREREHLEERKFLCDRFRRLPKSHWSSKVDLIMDNKKFQAPTHKRAKLYLRKAKVRGHLRTRSEGLKQNYTKPNPKKHRVNPGCSLSVCAGIINCRVKLWHYLPQSRWNGEIAAATHSGPILRALRRYRGAKRLYKVLEDNDPTGYKSNVAKRMKESLSIEPMEFPRISPDLNPMDFWLWAEVERRMEKNAPSRLETMAQCKARLRRTAFAIPESEVKKAVEDMKARAQAWAESVV